MNRTQLTGGIVLLVMAAALAPASAYHIDYIDPLLMPAGGSQPGDWTTAGAGAVTVCESNGPLDDRNSNPVPTQGVGGSCTTGRNDASGTLAPTAATVGAAGWSRLDLCSVLTGARTITAGAVSGNCASGLGATNQHFYTARVGAFQCEVPNQGGVVTDGPLGSLPQTATADFAFYYQELYAWWSYDGDSSYTTADAPGALHGGDSDTSDVVDVESAWHGHVTTFIVQAQSTGGSTTGSTEVTAAAPGGALSDVNGAGVGGVSNNCGGSPSAGPGTPPMQGPAIRAP